MDSSIECSLDLSIKKRKLEEIDSSLDDQASENTASDLKKKTQNGLNKISDENVLLNKILGVVEDDEINNEEINNEDNNSEKINNEIINNEELKDKELKNEESKEEKSKNEEMDYEESNDEAIIKSIKGIDSSHLMNGNGETEKEEVENLKEDNQIVDKKMNEEILPISSPKLKELTEDEVEQRTELCERLQNELSNEETTLLLLKKIQHSQMKENLAQQQQKQLFEQVQQQQTKQAAVANLVNQNLRNHVHLSRPLNKQQQQQQQLSNQHLTANNLNNISQLRNRGNSQLNRTVNQLNFAGQSLINGIAGKSSNNSLGRNSPHLQVSNNLLKRNSANSLINNSNFSNLVLGLQNQLNQRVNNSSPSPSTQQTKSSPAPNNATNQSTQQEFLLPAQQQAAKLQLKKQIEKTLTSIPNPKPINQEIHFIPNAQNQEFIYYFGLETVVDYLTGSNDENNSNKDNSTNGTNENNPPPPKNIQSEPLICMQCGTDFTPLWKFKELSAVEKRKQKERKLKDEKKLMENNGEINDKDEDISIEDKPEVLCEACVINNNKKKMKAEYAQILKAAFANAVQQEKELETKFAQMIAAQQEAQKQAATAAQQAQQQAAVVNHTPSPNATSNQSMTKEQINKQIQQFIQHHQLRNLQNTQRTQQQANQSLQQTTSKSNKSSLSNSRGGSNDQTSSSNQSGNKSSNTNLNVLGQLSQLGLNFNTFSALAQLVQAANGNGQQLLQILMNSQSVLGISQEAATTAVQLLLQQFTQNGNNNNNSNSSNQRQQQQQSNTKQNISNHQNSHSSSSNRNNHHNEAQQTTINQYHSSSSNKRTSMQPPVAHNLNTSSSNSARENSSSNSNNLALNLQNQLTPNLLLQMQATQKLAVQAGLNPQQQLLAQVQQQMKMQQKMQLQQLQQVQQFMSQINQLPAAQQQQILQLIAQNPSNLNILAGSLGKNGLGDLFNRR